MLQAKTQRQEVLERTILSHQTRKSILKPLLRNVYSLASLAKITNQSEEYLSHHVRMLISADIVFEVETGGELVYSVKSNKEKLVESYVF